MLLLSDIYLKRMNQFRYKFLAGMQRSLKKAAKSEPKPVILQALHAQI